MHITYNIYTGIENVTVDNPLPQKNIGIVVTNHRPYKKYYWTEIIMNAKLRDKVEASSSGATT